MGVGGVVVSRATLHNADHLAALDVRVGDVVVVQRAGDVIPQVVGFVPERRPSGTAPYSFPGSCPSCGSPTVKDGAFTRCGGGIACPAQAVEQIKHFASRDVLDIEGMGETTVEELHAAGLLRNPVDIYRLWKHEDLLSSMEGWGPRSASVLLRSIEDRREIGLDRLITSMGIREVGRTIGRLMAEHYGTVGRWMEAMRAVSDGDQAAVEELDAIDTVGPVIVDEIAKWFSNGRNRALVDELVREVLVRDHVRVVPSDSPLSGRTVVFTGTMERMDRKDAETHAIGLGAKTSGSVSAKTAFLVHGPGAGSKLEKATRIREEQIRSRHETPIEIMTEDEWFRFVGHEDAPAETQRPKP